MALVVQHVGATIILAIRFCDFAITDEAASAEIYGFIRPEYWKDARKAEKPIGTY
jgi:hypothetical protein